VTANADAKVRLRAELRERLARHPLAERERKSATIAGKLDALPDVLGASRLVVHRPLPSEVSIDPLLAHALGRGQQVLAPRVAGSRLELVVVEYETEWRRSTLGVLEPAKGKSFSLEELAEGSPVIVVPGLGFDERCRRLGRGGGHYDRFVAMARAAGRVLVIAVAFDLQIVPEVPTERHDETVDRVITEARVLARS